MLASITSFGFANEENVSDCKVVTSTVSSDIDPGDSCTITTTTTITSNGETIVYEETIFHIDGIDCETLFFLEQLRF